MIDYTPADTLIYLHVPKCGGTTIHGILRGNFSKGSRYYVDPSDVAGSRRELAAKSEQERRRIQLLHGHLSYGWHEHVANSAVYFTFIRHPVERVVSHYNYVRYRTDHDHYLRDAVEQEDMTIAEYVASGVCDETNNGQVRLLAGAEDIVQEPYGNSVLPYGTNDPGLLDRALQNIDNHFVFVGLQERFDMSLLLMRDCLQLETVTYQRKNIGTAHYRKRRPTDEDIEVIRKYNQLDFQLYQKMTERFDKAANVIRLPGLQLAWLGFRNRLHKWRTSLRKARVTLRETTFSSS